MKTSISTDLLQSVGSVQSSRVVIVCFRVYFQQAGERNGNKTPHTTLLLSLLEVCIPPKIRHLISASL